VYTLYVELNPIRADFVKQPQDWPWSSARSQIKGEDEYPGKNEATAERKRDKGVRVDFRDRGKRS